MSKLRSPDDLQKEALSPNDPDVYTNPEKVRLLDPREQMIATINMARTGQMVQNDQVRTMEAILAGAGYNVKMDGQFSAEEMAAMKHFKDKLEDKNFKETGLTLLSTIAGAAVMEKLISPQARQEAIQKLSQWLPKPSFAPS